MLDKTREGIAKEHARKVLKKINLNIYPVDLMKILDFYDYKYIEVKTWENHINALLIHKDNNVYLTVNGNHHEHRKRFSIAHELGHLILGHDLKYYKRPITFNDIPISIIKEHMKIERIFETEANIFAGEILVPLNWLKIEFKKHPDKNDIKKISENLSNIFNVSSDVISIRISNNLRSLY